MAVDQNDNKDKAKHLSVSKLSVDIVGVEETTENRKWVFLSLATELFDEEHPPPHEILESQATEDGPELF